MKAIFIGSVEFSAAALKKLIILGVDIRGVITTKETGMNADYADISKIAKRNEIPCLFVKNINDKKNIMWIENKSPDIIFCFGFSRILGKRILGLAPVIGYHPSELPKNRGRHPIIWAIVLGLKKTASTLFLMDEGADTGDILSQRIIKIDTEETARTLYDKLTRTALLQLDELIPRLEKGTFKARPQDGTNANVWRLRSKSDGKIDFRMSALDIDRLVRALTRPYAGAHVVYKGKEIKVWETRIGVLSQDNAEFGKIIKVKGRAVTVKCSGGTINLLKHEFGLMPKAGEYFYE